MALWFLGIAKANEDVFVYLRERGLRILCNRLETVSQSNVDDRNRTLFNARVGVLRNHRPNLKEYFSVLLVSERQLVIEHRGPRQFPLEEGNRILYAQANRRAAFARPVERLVGRQLARRQACAPGMKPVFCQMRFAYAECLEILRQRHDRIDWHIALSTVVSQ